MISRGNIYKLKEGFGFYFIIFIYKYLYIILYILIYIDYSICFLDDFPNINENFVFQIFISIGKEGVWFFVIIF